MVGNIRSASVASAILGLPGMAAAQTAVVTYDLGSFGVPALGAGTGLLLGLFLFVAGAIWLRKHPDMSFRKLAIGAIAIGSGMAVFSGNWLVRNAEALVPVTTYLFSENPSPATVANFPAVLQNDLQTPATLRSITVNDCAGEIAITGTCQPNLVLAANGGSCNLDSVCNVAVQQCDTGTDPGTGSPWVVCSADANQAWISADDYGQYHAELICQSLGYNTVGIWSGTCGNVCGYCEDPTSCSSPGTGPEVESRSWDAFNCGTDALGRIICNTVQWTCVM